MRYLLIALAVCVLAPITVATAQSRGPTDIVAFPEDAGAARKTTESAGQNFYTLETPLKIIAADPAAAAVVDKDVPGLLSDPHYPMIEGMGLRDIAALSGGELNPQMLAQAEADLRSVPRKAGEACQRLQTESVVLLGDRRLPVVLTDC
jgi:hypothetical protein